MANTRDSAAEQGRRRFMAVVGVVAATAALPSQARGMKRVKSWSGLLGQVLPELRAAYLAEVERFAQALEPRFRSGELRGYTGEDAERDVHLDNEESARAIPFWRLQDLCGQHFGVGGETEDEESTVRELMSAGAILAASPSAPSLERNGYNDPGSWAVMAVTWDVLGIARARGWYVPAADEERLEGVPGRYTLDDEPIALGEFLEANAGDPTFGGGLTPAERERIGALQPGQSVVIGGGAGAEFTLRREA